MQRLVREMPRYGLLLVMLLMVMPVAAQTSAVLTVTPPAAPAGSIFEIDVTGLDAGTEVVVTLLSTASGETVAELDASADSAGTAQVTFDSLRSVAPGLYLASARTRDDVVVAQTVFTIGAPESRDLILTVTPELTTPNIAHDVSVRGLDNAEPVEITITLDAETVVSDTYTADEAGTVAFALDTGEYAPGTYIVTASAMESTAEVTFILEPREIGLTVEPQTVYQGQPFTITVTDLEPGEQVDITLYDGSVAFTQFLTADDSGVATGDVTFSVDDPIGVYTVTAVVVAAQAQTELTVDPRALEVSVTPVEGAVGTEFAFSVSGALADEVVTVAVSRDGETVYSNTFVADGENPVEFNLFSTSPNDVGEYVVTATIEVGATDSATLAVTGPVRNPQLTVRPEAARASSQFTFVVADVEPGSEVTLDFVFDDVVVFTTSRIATRSGTATFVINSSRDDGVGDYTVNALVDGETIATGNFTLQAPPPLLGVSVDPESGEAGTAHMITIDNAHPGSDVSVVITLDDDIAYSRTFTAADDGTVNFSVYSSSADAPGTYTVTASAADTVPGSAELVIEGTALAPEMTIVPTEATQGGTITVLLRNVEPGADVTLDFMFDDETVFTTTRPANRNGVASFPITTNLTDAPGDYSVSASVNGETVADGIFSLAERPRDLVLRVSPTEAVVGTEHVITVTGLSANETVTIDITHNGENVYNNTFTTDENGRVQVSVFSDSDDEPGTYAVVATTPDGQVETVELTITAIVYNPEVTVTPGAGAQGTTFTITVADVEPGARVVLDFIYDGAAVYNTSRIANSNGMASFAITSDTTDSPGTYMVRVSVSEVSVAETSFEITSAEAPRPTDVTIAIDPAAGIQGTRHSVTVTGLPAGSSGVLDVVFAGASVFSTEFTADASGTYTTGLVTDASDSNGVYTVNIVLDGEIVASGDFAVGGDVEPPVPTGNMSITPASGPRGTNHAIEVRGLQPGAAVTLDIAFNGQSVFSTTGTAGNDGIFTFSVVSEASDPAGTYTITATVGGEVVGSSELTITEEGAQPPTPTGAVVMTITPTAGAIGTTHNVEITGLAPDTTVTVDVVFEGTIVYSNNYPTDENGVAFVRLQTEAGDQPGLYVVVVRQAGEIVVTSELVIEGDAVSVPQAEIFITPAEGPNGTTYHVEVRGLEPDSTITLVVSYDGTAVFSNTYTANAEGIAVAELVSEASDPAGTYTVDAVLGDEVIASGAFAITDGGGPSAVQMTITPDSGPVGTRHVVEITGLQPDSTVRLNVTFEGRVLFSGDYPASSEGVATVDLQSDASDVPGSVYTVDAVVNDQIVASAELTITDDSVQPPAAVEVTVNPPGGPIGTTHEVRVVGLQPNAQVTLQVLDGDRVLFENTYTADDSGMLVVPLVTDDTDRPNAVYVVNVLVGGQVVGSGELAIEGDAVQPTEVVVMVEPASGPIGTAHIVTITGLEPNSAATLEVVYEGRVLLETSGTASDLGSWMVNLITDETDTPGATYTINVRVGGQVAGRAELTITDGDVQPPSAATMTITPESGPVGTIHNVMIVGAPPNTTINIDVQFNGQSVYNADYETNPNGVLQFRLESEATDPPGSYAVVATIDGMVIARTTLVVTQIATGNVTVSPAEGPIGSNHDIVVTGLEAGQQVTISIVFADTGEEVYSTTRAANDNGAVVVTIFTEAGDAPGVYTVTVASAGGVIGQAGFVALEAQPPVLGGNGDGGTPTPATGTPIAPGDVLTDELTDAEPAALYSFEGQAGQTVTITMESTVFDSYLVLLGVDGNPVAEDDDSAGDLNAQIRHTLAEDGTYTIIATSLLYSQTNGERYSVGEFTVTFATSEVGPTPTPDAPDTNIPYEAVIGVDESITGGVTPDEPTVTYAFVGEAGQSILISLTSSDFDTYLILQDADGNELTFNDDGGQGLNSLIGPYIIPEDGTYLIVATSFSQRTGGTAQFSGQFELTVIGNEVRRIEYGMVITSELEGGIPFENYSFVGQAGDTISISLETGAFFSYINIATASNPTSPIAVYDSTFTSERRSSQIGPFTLPDTGEYIITAGGYTDNGGGSYTLRLDRVTIEPIAYADSFEVEFTESDQVFYFSFNGEAGDVINIIVDSDSTIDTSLQLTFPDGETLFDDDGGSGFDPEFNQIVLPRAGEYIVRLETFTRGETGTVTMTLERSAVPSLDEGTQRIRLNDKQSLATAVFTGVAGETVRLTVAVVAPDMGQPTVRVTQNGQTLATVSLADISRVSIDFEVPEDGEVLITIDDTAQSNSAFDLSLERLP